mgnify:CR=1 FL=1
MIGDVPNYVAGICHSLYNDGAKYAHMTGSGSVVFGMFDTEELRDNAARAFGSAYQIWKTHIISGL